MASQQNIFQRKIILSIFFKFGQVVGVDLQNPSLRACDITDDFFAFSFVNTIVFTDTYYQVNKHIGSNCTQKKQ